MTDGVKSVERSWALPMISVQSPGLERAAVAEFGERELLARLLREELDEGHVADLVAADGDRVVQLAIGQPAGERRA